MAGLRARRVRTGATYSRPLCAWLLLVGVMGCGGEAVDAPYTASSDRCPELDDHLAPLLKLAEEEQLGTLREVMAEDLSDDDRDDLVQLLLDLVGALEPDAVAALADADLDTEQITAAEETLASLCRWLAAEGPGAPYAATMSFAGDAMGSCDGPPLFALVQELLEEEALVRSVLAAATDPQLDIQEVLDGLDSSEDDPVSGLRALLRNLLTAATKPGFDVQEWTSMLGVVLASTDVDVDSPPWSDLIAGLEAFLMPGPRLEALQSIVTCLLVVDPELVWVDPIYHLLTSPPDLAISLEDVAGGETAEPLVPAALQPPLDAAIAMLRADASARQTLVRTLTALLEPHRATGVLLDLATLFEAQSLMGMLEGVVAVVARDCAP